MTIIHDQIQRLIRDTSQRYGISQSAARRIFLMPFVIIGCVTLLLGLPFTRAIMRLMLQENNAIELATFGFLMVGAWQGTRLGWAVRKQERLYVSAFYLSFAFVLFFIAMEEIAWGQWFLHFETPDLLKEINQQGELTLHNIAPMHGNTEFLRAGFGIGGLVGLALGAFAPFRQLSPPAILVSWFSLIAVFGALDATVDFVKIQYYFDRWVDSLAEVVEMLIGMASLLFMTLKRRCLNLHVPAP